MVPFLPFHPGILAIAQELQRRANAGPEQSILEHLTTIVTERPKLHIEDHVKLAEQLNDLMDIANPPEDRVRLSVMLFLPHRRGTLFTASNMLLRDVLFFPGSPVSRMTQPLAKSLDEVWGSVVETVKNMPLPAAPILGANGAAVPAEARHPAAAGPLPENIQQFMKPDGQG